MALFSQCEEAFLLKNVQNVIDVWARGSGLARLNFCTRNGQAELQLFYQLGHPEAPHLLRQPVRHRRPQGESPPARQKQKSQKRILKDRKRAADYQARRRAEENSSPSSPSTTSSTPITTTTTTTSMAASSLGMSPVISSSTAVTSSMPSFYQSTAPSHQPTLAPVNLAMASTTSPSQPTIATAVTSPGNCTPTTEAQCSTTPSLATPISFPAVTSSHERCDLFDEMDTLPLPQYPDCSACRENFNFPCFATPCIECGEWFHNGCVIDHSCGSDTDDDFASYADLD
jgi:hypothetical protein